MPDKKRSRSDELAAPAPRAYIAAMFIETETTPNPASLKFLPGRQVMPAGTREFADPRPPRRVRSHRRCSTPAR